MDFITIIPARFASTRLPGKPLVDINGKPMIIHVMERALEAGSSRVIIATDHADIKYTVERAGGEACMTRTDHNSGTERLVEVIEKYALTNNQIILNIQGDEPFLQSTIIRQVVCNLVQNKVEMATMGAQIITSQEAFNPNIIKVVCNKKGYALYFSRATIPWERERFMVSKNNISHNFLRHIGIYAYRAGFIRKYVTWSASPIEQIEMLEQLRVLWYGKKIHVGITAIIPITSIDTIEDLEKVRKIFATK
ncbi:3-deoxy-manno-octulosonate cytidylyltransferase [Candidatus Profftia lariciata]|uniref:3-deoxy-manno-octulosonate cytidylyltransferase n=1 Tax=Candidatus Profftia lariciata TaxID=1987921 RepID=UPI001D012EB2|nr:3-deoxy-manno-octulosonate cytidylyltransferase [Candidatus Profftia lariciata]UDG81359.1 3-deoxy-manno-octulosonate cytidylyltransferase [Candidatus Profftia lariciata]